MSSTHWLATEAGAAMFGLGGTAADAAVAAAFVLHVAEPHLNGLGGDVTILCATSGREPETICGQGPMPAAASVAAFTSLGLAHVPASGLLAATVPGAFGAWMALLRRHGRLPLGAVLSPAIDHAVRGVPLLPKAATMIASLVEVFRDHWPTSAETYLRGSRTAPVAGERWANPVLADTYRRLVATADAKGDRESGIAAAEDAFYRGFVAEAVDDFLGGTACLDATGEVHHGFLRGTDLEGWHAPLEPTRSLEFQGQRVHKAGPWTQGPVFLQQLALLDSLPLGDHLGPDHLHLCAEAAKLAFADREAWYADPHFAPDRVSALLDPHYTADRRTLLGETASAELRPGTVEGTSPVLPDIPVGELGPTQPAWLVQLREGQPLTVAQLQATEVTGDTCTVVAADAEGLVVAATPSGGWLKGSPVVPGLGFALGTRGQMAWLDPRHPNALAPGKRPRTTLSPTLVETADGGLLGIGTPGGDQQDQWTLHAFLSVTADGDDLQRAVEKPTFHSEHAPTSFAPRRARPRQLVVETGIDPATSDELRRRGHLVTTVPARSLGKVCLAQSHPSGCRAAASPNGDQAAAAGA